MCRKELPYVYSKSVRVMAESNEKSDARYLSLWREEIRVVQARDIAGVCICLFKWAISFANAA